MVTEKTLDEVLAHYGVKGMKWGVRRDRRELDRSAGRRKKQGKPVTPTKRQARKAAKAEARKPSEDAAKTKDLVKQVKKGGVQTLTNQQLQDLNTRLNLEQQYSNLTTQQSTTSKGQKRVKTILGVGKTANEVITFVNSPLGQQIASTVKKS